MGLKKLVLIVEDNDAVRQTTKAWLEAAGFRVVCAADGRDALELLRRPDRPSLILLDLEMPVMGGREFRARQLQSPPIADIPVVLVSSEPDLAGTAASLSAAAHFPKPARFDSLLRAVRELCEAPTPA